MPDHSPPTFSRTLIGVALRSIVGGVWGSVLGTLFAIPYIHLGTHYTVACVAYGAVFTAVFTAVFCHGTPRTLFSVYGGE